MSSPVGQRLICVSRTRAVVELHISMSHSDVVRVREQVEALLHQATPVRLEICSSDLAVIEAVVRMRLCARRLQAHLEVTDTDGRFARLAELAGLSDVLEVVGKAEPGEKRGVEEVVDVGDPSA
jgi:hypothetical protein